MISLGSDFSARIPPPTSTDAVVCNLQKEAINRPSGQLKIVDELRKQQKELVLLAWPQWLILLSFSTQAAAASMIPVLPPARRFSNDTKLTLLEEFRLMRIQNLRVCLDTRTYISSHCDLPNAGIHSSVERGAWTEVDDSSWSTRAARFRIISSRRRWRQAVSGGLFQWLHILSGTTGGNSSQLPPRFGIWGNANIDSRYISINIRRGRWWW